MHRRTPYVENKSSNVCEKRPAKFHRCTACCYRWKNTSKKKIVAVSIFVWPLNVWAVSARERSNKRKKYKINLFLCIFCRIKVSFPVDWILILRSTPAVTENSSTTSKMYEWMVTDGTNDACLNKSHLIICWMAPNVCMCECVVLYDWMSRHATAIRNTPRRKKTFFLVPDFISRHFFLSFLLFGAQFAHVKLVLLLFLFSLSAHRSSPGLFYITLIFWYLLISVVPLKFIYYTFADTSESCIRKNMANAPNAAQAALMLKNRIHIEVYRSDARTGDNKTKQQEAKRKKSNIIAVRGCCTVASATSRLSSCGIECERNMCFV